MNIVLISPQPDIQAFGLRSISSCLKEEGHNVKIIFLFHNFSEKYSEKILDQLIELIKNVDLIGISVMTPFFANAIQITQRLKKELDVPIVWGGVHSIIRPLECLKYADMVCIGEGEETIPELIKNLNIYKQYHTILGLWYKEKGKIIKNKLRPLIRNLDKIPFLDYKYDCHYILEGDTIKKMDRLLMKKYSDGVYITMATRGCPFGCSYCFNNTLNKMYPSKEIVRKRSVSHLINELIKVKENNCFEYIKFDDDAFFSNSLKDIQKFCKEYKKRINLPLIISGATPATITKEKLDILANAGLIHIRMGIQTASEDTKRLYKRSYSNEQIIKAANLIGTLKDKMWPPKYDIILDNPFETDEDLIKTLKFLVKLPVPYHLSIYSLAFYPATELYKKAKKIGMIKDEFKDIYQKDYEQCRDSYLNNLFFLLRDYAIQKIKIPAFIMDLLTKPTLRQLKLHLGLYYSLKIGIIVLGTSKSINKFLKYSLNKNNQ